MSSGKEKPVVRSTRRRSYLHCSPLVAFLSISKHLTPYTKLVAGKPGGEWRREYWGTSPRSRSVIVSSGCHNKTPEPAWLKKQKSLFLPFQRPEVQDQGAIRVGFREDLSSWLVHGHLLATSSYSFSLHATRDREISGLSSLMMSCNTY